MNIYLVWWHDEDGPKGLRATTNKPQLRQVLEKVIDHYLENAGWIKSFADALPDQVLAEFDKLILKSDKELLKVDHKYPLNTGIHNLGMGWGGINLQIVEEE